MVHILSLETSTNVCSVAVHEGERLLATAEVHIDQSHGSKLAVLIEEILKIAEVQRDQLQAVAISAGPGSYTGLRIGTSTAKGLCYGLNIPLIAVGTLELLAFQVSRIQHHDGLLCPMIDARRMEVYCLLADQQLNIIKAVEAKVIDEYSFAETLADREIIFFGNGAEKCNTVIRHSNAHFIKEIYAKASDLGLIALARFNEGRIENLTDFEPMYVKGFVAKKSKSLI